MADLIYKWSITFSWATPRSWFSISSWKLKVETSRITLWYTSWPISKHFSKSCNLLMIKSKLRWRGYWTTAMPKLKTRKRARNQQLQVNRMMLKAWAAKMMKARWMKLGMEVKMKKMEMIMVSLMTWTCKMMKKNLAMIWRLRSWENFEMLLRWTMRNKRQMSKLLLKHSCLQARWKGSKNSRRKKWRRN